MENYFRNVLDPGFTTKNSPPQYPYRLLTQQDLVFNQGVNYTNIAKFVELYHSMDAKFFYRRKENAWYESSSFDDGNRVIANDKYAQHLDTTSKNLIYGIDPLKLKHSESWFFNIETTLTSSAAGIVGGSRRITLRSTGTEFYIRGYTTNATTFKDRYTAIPVADYVGKKATFTIRHLAGYDGVHFYIDGVYKAYLTIGDASVFPSDNGYLRASWDGGSGVTQKVHTLSLLQTITSSINNGFLDNTYGILTTIQTVANDGWYAELFKTTEQLIAINQALETNVAQAITKQKTKQIAQAAETNTTFSLSSGTIKSILQAVENDTAQSSVKLKTIVLAQAQEVDASQSATTQKLKSIWQVQEADNVYQITKLKSKQILHASEVDIANLVTMWTSISIDKVFEYDNAKVLSITKTNQTGQVFESDIANAIIIGIAFPAGIVSEIDIAQSLSHYKSKTLLQAVEADIANSVASIGIAKIGYTQEVDTAFPITKDKTKHVSHAIETDVAQIILYPKIVSVGKANEINIAFPLTIAGVGIIFRDSIRYNAYIARKIMSKTKIGKSILNKVEL